MVRFDRSGTFCLFPHSTIVYYFPCTGLSYFLLDSVPTLREHHGVDPFTGNYDSTDNISNMLGRLNASAVWAMAVLDILKDHGCKFRFHYGRSLERASDFEAETIDCIFVDGDHTYEGTRQDIKVRREQTY